jgi:streptogramin lyase
MIARVVVLAVALAAAFLAGCGGDDAGDGDRTSARERGAPEVATVPDRPRRTTPLGDVREASLSLPGGPDWLAALDGYVWVKRDDGVVTRVDPRATEPAGEVRADTKSDQFCQGIGAGGGAIWSCSGSDVVRIDPKRVRVVASVPVGKVFDQGRLVFADGHIWVIAGEGDRLVGIDVATSKPGPEVALPVICSELAPGPHTVWALCPGSDKVVAVDVAARSVVGELDLESPSAAYGTETDLWVGYRDGLARVDAETLEQVAIFANLDPGADGDVTVDAGNVWVRSADGFLHRIDERSNAVVEQIEPERRLSSGSLLAAEGSLWTTAYDDNVLLRLRPGSD